MSKEFVAIIGVLIGGFFTLAGSFLANEIQARKEHRQWLRAEKMKIYLNLLDTVYQMRRDGPNLDSVQEAGRLIGEASVFSSNFAAWKKVENRLSEIAGIGHQKGWDSGSAVTAVAVLWEETSKAVREEVAISK